MAWLYDQIPSTREQCFRQTLVLMKCSQVGFTVMETLAAIYLGLKFGPCTVGLFLPDQHLAEFKSSERFMPMVRSASKVHDLMTQDASDGGARRSPEGSLGRRRIGSALYVFSWTSGRSSTESVPMDFLLFDEVQGMTLEQMERTRERLSASDYRYTLMGSTPNWPEEDIHFWYRQGTRHAFHTLCPDCGTKRPLVDYFPECIRWDPEHPHELTGRPGCYRYVCEAGHWIDDPQQGEWIAEDPDARIVSAHFPQILSPTISAGEIMEKFENASDRKNFYNRVLGRPYLDPTQTPVTLAHMANCVAAGKAAGVKWKRGSRGAFMGVDQMANYNVVVIKERLDDGRRAVIHLEEINDAHPFERCSELMTQYGVGVCVVEINPNYNDAKDFAVRHRGKVFLCNSFGSIPDDMLLWGDGPKLDSSGRRTNEEERDRYTVRIDQFKCMSRSLAQFTAEEPHCLFPPPKDLQQEIIEKGRRQMAPVADRAFLHFTKTALVSERDEETNQYKRVVRKVGIDPHYSYANLLCDVALARAHGTATFLIPETKSEGQQAPEKDRSVKLVGAPETRESMLIQSLMEPPPPEETCGGCEAFPLDENGAVPACGRCRERDLKVEARQPGCPLFVDRDSLL
jgi:hypothetical protein